MKEKSLSKWIEGRLLRGYYTFTREETEKNFPESSSEYLSTALYRLTTKGKIISPWRNFFVIIPVEYALKGIVPPMFYIDSLMSYLGRKYYVALLNAAAFYGASHQRPQTYSVMIEAPKIRNTARNGTSILFFSKKDIPTRYIRQHKAQSGYINVSSPELTAIDLIENEKNVGGLNRVCTVLNELAESMDFRKIEEDFFSVAPLPVFQRLGYILEKILEREELAGILYEKITSAGLQFRKVPFKAGKPMAECNTDNKWKISINEEIEIDE